MFQNVSVLKTSNKVSIVSVNILCVLTSSLHILCVYSVWTVSVFSKPASVILWENYGAHFKTHLWGLNKIFKCWCVQKWIQFCVIILIINCCRRWQPRSWQASCGKIKITSICRWTSTSITLWYGCFPYPSFCQQFTNPTPSLVWTPKHYCDQVLFDQEEYFSKHAYAITLCWQRRCCWWWFQHS